MHAAAGPLRSTVNTDWHFMNIITCFSFTAVPLFIMMSGYLILNSEKTADINFLFKKRLPRLIIPLAGWSVVSIIWKLIINNNLSLAEIYNNIVSTLQSPAWVHLWYMYTLIVLYIISPLIYGALNSLDKKGHILVFSIICLISLCTILQIVLPDFLKPYAYINIINQLSFLEGLLAVFILGYYLGNTKIKIPNIILILSAIVILLIIILGTYKFTLRDGQFNQTFQNQYSGFEIVLASCVFLLFKQNFNKSSRILKNIPIITLSLPIYLMHNILLSMMSYLFPINTFWDTIYSTAINFVICFLTVKTLASIKPICFLSTGIPFKEACKTCNWFYTYNKIKSFANKSNNKL